MPGLKPSMCQIHNYLIINRLLFLAYPIFSIFEKNVSIEEIPERFED